MPAGPRSSSSRAATLVALSALLAISGCAGRNALFSGSSAETPLRLTTKDEQPAIVTDQPAIRPAAESSPGEDIVMAASPPARSAWCDYLAADAAADATILRAPTLGATIDDEGKGSVNLSLSLSGLRKAQLIEESAEARCRRHLAETGLQKVVFLAPQTLSAAGYGSKARSIAKHFDDLEGMRREIRNQVLAGTITADKAASLTASIDAIHAAAAEARSQSDRREAAGDTIAGPASDYTAALLRAESDLDEITSKIRSADSFDVSLEGGYSDGDVGDGFDRAQDGVSGKVKFSMKLGAFTPKRYEHERRAREARLAAVTDGEGGALWQIETLRQAHLKAVAGLEDSRRRLDNALAETRKFLKLVNSTPDPEFSGARIEARLRMIQLEAEHAAVDGSLGEIRSKLKQLGPG